MIADGHSRLYTVPMRARILQRFLGFKSTISGSVAMLRSPQYISVSEAKAPFFVGIDLGGTRVKIGVVDDQGQPLSRLTIATEGQRGPEDAARRMGQTVLDAIREVGIESAAAVARVGLASPGTVDVAAGTLVAPANLNGWSGFPMCSRLGHHCGLPVVLANDTVATSYGEYWVGSGRAFHSMILLTLGTGIGSGIIIGDLSIDGENSYGAECGHIVIDRSDKARPCGCGRTGHLEAYASATAVLKRAQEGLDAGRECSLRRRIDEGTTLSPQVIAAEAEAGDAFSLELVDDTARFLGIGITSLLHTIDPSGVLLAGDMTFGGNETTVGRRFLARVKQEVQRHAFPILAERTVIDFASLGDDAGYIGAAGIARLEHQKAGC
jgi:glucokinase